MNTKSNGLLLGLHVGDSLGSTVEFSPARPRDNFHTEMLGGGPFDLLAGDPTDDTEMMICLLRTLSTFGRLNPEDYVKNLLSWFHSNPRDIGHTISVALARLDRGRHYTESGMNDEYSQGNGSLMRCAPLALIHFDEEAITLQCSITHAHQTCIDADLIFINSLQMCLSGKSKEEIYNLALIDSQNRNPQIHEALLEIPNLSWDELPSSGYVLHTLTTSYWAFLNTPSFKDALIQAVNRGGDADTTGAVTGALCGAYYGLGSIPIDWLSKIKKKEEIEDLVHSLSQFP